MTYIIRLLGVLLFALLSATALTMGLSVERSVYAQNTTATPEPTLDTTILKLQQTVNDLATQVAYFKTEVALNKTATATQAFKDMLPFIIFMSIVAAIGVGSPIVLLQQTRAKMEERLNAAIYRADPTYMPLHIPAANFELEAQRLKLLGFQNLRPYVSLTHAQLNGIVVHRADSLPDIEVLENFIQREQAQPKQVAFIIYTSGHIEGGERIYKTFENITFANNTVTIATHIYALARGLTQG